MQTVTGIMLIAYVMGILPILLGIAFNRVFFVKKYELSDVYVKGYLILFATFAAEAVLLIRMGKNLHFLTRCWMLTVAAVGVIALAIGFTKLPTFFREVFAHTRSLMTQKIGVALVIAALALMAFAILFVKPLPDGSVEYALAAIDSNHMYYYHPYTTESHVEFEAGKRIAPIEMFYATLAVQTGIAPATVMKLLAPILLIPLFYAAVWQMGSTLFDGDEHRICVFGLATMALATIPIYSGNEYLAWAIYRNSWNGLVLLNSVIFPYAVIWCLGSLRKAKKREVKLQDVVMLGVLAAAAQLMQARGVIYVAVIVIIWFIIGIVERICKHGIRN